MKTTSVDLFNSIVPGVLSMRLANKEIELSDEYHVEANFSSFIESDLTYQSFITYFDLRDINPALMLKAFSHSSFINEYGLAFKESDLSSYERLELLGDSVLELIITEILFREFPTLSEGALSKIRGQLVSKQEISKLSELIGLTHFVMVGRGEYAQKIYNKDSIKADIFESVLGPYIKVMD